MATRRIHVRIHVATPVMEHRNFCRNGPAVDLYVQSAAGLTDHVRQRAREVTCRGGRTRTRWSAAGSVYRRSSPPRRFSPTTSRDGCAGGLILMLGTARASAPDPAQRFNGSPTAELGYVATHAFPSTGRLPDRADEAGAAIAARDNRVFALCCHDCEQSSGRREMQQAGRSRALTSYLIFPERPG